MDIVLILLICTFATFIGAVSGIGGGIIIKPFMDAISGLPVSTISFLSGSTVLAMTTVTLLSGSLKHIRNDFKKKAFLASGAVAGGLIGKRLFEAIRVNFANDGLIGVVQGSVMIFLTVGVLLYVLNKNKIHTRNIQNSLICIVIGMALGLLGSFLGIGGGPINLAALYFFFSMDTKEAAFNSLFIIFFSQLSSLALTLVEGAPPNVDSYMLIAMIVCGVVGGLAGRRVSKKMSNQIIDKLFIAVLIVIILVSCFNVYRYSNILGV